MNTKVTDTEVYNLAIKKAHHEFVQHARDYTYTVDDLAQELYSHYLAHTKSRLEQADNPMGFVSRDMDFGLSHIRRREIQHKRRFKVISDLIPGDCYYDEYFDLILTNGNCKLGDNDIIIDQSTKATKAIPLVDTQHANKPMLNDNERNDIWTIIASQLSERDYRIVYLVFVTGLTERQIADEIGISHQAVHKVITKLPKLQSALAEYRDAI